MVSQILPLQNLFCDVFFVFFFFPEGEPEHFISDKSIKYSFDAHWGEADVFLTQKQSK